MNHHGINQPRGLNSTTAKEGRFGHLFSSLPRLISDPNELEEVGKVGGVMDEDTHGSIGSTTTPLGYVFLGQFIDHDITLDVISSFNKINDPEAIQNFRTPALDLDCIYGSGPEASPYLYFQAPKDGTDREKAISGRLLLTLKDDLVRAPSYPDGNTKRAALIGDPRNDENRIVSQIQLTMHFFHNAVVNYILDNLEKLKLHEHEIFEEAQRLTRWHYQWVIVNDFLKRIVGKELVEDILYNGKKLYQDEGKPYIPVEFAVAAYRFGHTMVTKKLKYNAKHLNVELFGPELGDGFSVNQAGAADMENFFGPKAQTAGAVNIRMQGDLLKLPFMPCDTPPAMLSLATRNLLRSQSFGLPSGQNVHIAVSEACGINLDSPDLSGFGFPEGITKSTPLWLYILAEGALSGGQQLGPVGGRIVAEVLIGLLENDNTSYLGRDRSWYPSFVEKDQDWDMAALVKFAEKAR
ncbi:hypothetical protein AB3A93_000894 [Vibrio parahaemolyticus]|uniref:peroxidase family protein n=1 Tax=Vibrio parahaemolyticus TaxID=670 RepID=UPI00215C5567|nr:heme peroxidase family protein [Vibrio parahaemolyticus]ELB2918129.1 hypothetical protein [Vibrio parahaemolyticus]MCR9851358.1 heme peroxidase family protein [Vibrio parahaemolyticus]HCM0864496.1 hypothetical protein [Vibrio parahaemolyticus]HCM0868570.1 hypothetical protein [Vibrio parahaemolyticus]